MRFLRQTTGQKEKWQRDGTWRSEAADKFIKEAGTQSLGAYIDKRQATVAEWVALRPIIEVYDKETCNDGGRRRCLPWWQETAERKHLSATLKYILAATRDRRWKSGRRGKGGIGREVAEAEYDSERDGNRYAGTETCESQVGK